MKARDIVKNIGLFLMILSIFLPGSDLYNPRGRYIEDSVLYVLIDIIDYILCFLGFSLCVLFILSSFIPKIKENKFVSKNEKKLTFLMFFVMLAFSLSSLGYGGALSEIFGNKFSYYMNNFISMGVAGGVTLIGLLMSFFAIGPKNVISALKTKEN